MMIFGILLFIGGYFLRYTMNRRAFNRRNSAGVEEFSSFEAATGNKVMEGAGRIIGAILMVIGALLAIIRYFGNS